LNMFDEFYKFAVKFERISIAEENMKKNTTAMARRLADLKRLEKNTRARLRNLGVTTSNDTAWGNCPEDYFLAKDGDMFTLSMNEKLEGQLRLPFWKWRSRFEELGDVKR